MLQNKMSDNDTRSIKKLVEMEEDYRYIENSELKSDLISSIMDGPKPYLQIREELEEEWKRFFESLNELRTRGIVQSRGGRTRRDEEMKYYAFELTEYGEEILEEYGEL